MLKTIPNYKIIEPSTQEEFEAYFQLRWEVLRKPWNMAKGSEKDELENKSLHGMIIEENGNCIATCRLNLLPEKQAQIRYMAVSEKYQGKGLGSMIISFIEEKAKTSGAEKIILHARENAVSFYKSNNYEIVEKSYMMWGCIQHYLMYKRI